jgi:hypothetical protein
MAEERLHDQSSAEIWRNVADAVERLWPTPQSLAPILFTLID